MTADRIQGDLSDPECQHEEATPDGSSLYVVHVISGLLHGGAETVLHRLVTAPGTSVRHTVISMGGEGVMGPTLRQEGVEVLTLDMQGVWGVLRGLWRLFWILRERQPDVVQTWMYHADLLGGLVARLAGIRAVAWGIRNSGVSLAESSRSSRITAWICARLSGWLPGVIVACARRAAEVHQGWGYRADRMLVVPNGYDLSVWHPDADDGARWRSQWGVAHDTVLLGSVARWNPQKDHANLLAAVGLVVRRYPALRCVLIGLGMSRDNASLIELARHYGLLDHLIFLGRRDDVPSLMRALDVHVLSSKAEGFPNVVSEAMASGVACAVTDAGDAADIVAGHGWVAPVQDAAALAGAIEQAIAAAKGPEWASLSEAARASVARRYSLQSMVDRYEVVWRRLAADYPTRRRLGAPQPMRGRAASAETAGSGPSGASASRLLFVVNNPAFFLSHRLPLALAAREAGYDVHVATMDGPSVAEIRAHGLTHHIVPLSRSGTNPWTETKSLWAIWRLLRVLRPALVHAVTIKPVLYGGIACRLAGVPAFVAAISGLGYVFMQTTGARGLLRRVALMLYRFALTGRDSRVIFQNAADRDVLVAAGAVRPDQVVMLRGSGVDLDRFAPQPWPEEPVSICMASRLLRDKGVEEFAAAARMARDRGATLRWRLAGSPDPGNPASVDLALVRGWESAGLLEYVGECTDVAALYAQSHIVVLPSYREGLPKSLIEAAACGRPVVTTDVPGCRDAVEPGVSGLLVPPRDARALADAVLRLADDASLRERMGAAGRALAERDFGLAGVVQAHLDLYAELIGSERQRPTGQ
ncbi:MAG: glycosyltransferase [Castellaniella sp.]|nr:glycosyltransferase [Castellaniella sp.]TAN28944.1 MAG: glycosyltransferase [Castellaniella sp.]